jgi:hypothetical protein
VVFAWIMQLPSRPIPLTGSGRIEAIAVAVAGASFKLSRSDWFAILRAARGHEGRMAMLKIVEGRALSAQQKKDLLNRLARRRPAARHPEAGGAGRRAADCDAVAQQMAAARKALDRSFVQLLTAAS